MKKILLALTLISGYLTLSGQEIKIDRQVTMLALGDSYTIGESVDTIDRWPHQFIDQLRNLGVEAEYPDYIATTGWTTRRLIQGINSMLDKEKTYNLVSILIGVNNQYQGIDISSYEPDLKIIIDKALEIVDQDHSRIFILSIPDYAYTPFGAGNNTISQEIDDYNIIKKKVAAEYGIAFIDITPISRLGLSNSFYVAGDGLHPSGVQYREWVKAILPRLNLDKTLSVDDQKNLQDSRLTVYPNPAGSVLFIESERAITRIRIVNTLGGVVSDLTQTSMPVQLDLSHLQPGIYTLLVDHHGDENTASPAPYIIQILHTGFQSSSSSSSPSENDFG